MSHLHTSDSVTGKIDMDLPAMRNSSFVVFPLKQPKNTPIPKDANKTAPKTIYSVHFKLSMKPSVTILIPSGNDILTA